MADREIDLKIVVDDSGAIQSINGVDEAIQKSQKSAESFASTFGSALLPGLAAAAAGVIKLGSVTGEFLTIAREIEDLSGGFQTLSERVGNVPTEKLDALKAATQGLTTEMDIMRAANQAVLLGVDDGSGKFEEMAAAAVKLGNAMGISTTEALERMVIGLGRGSKQILDDLGVMVNAEKAYKNYASAHDLVASKLTETQKKMAFLVEGQKQILESAASLPGSAESAATAYERLQTSASDARGEFAKGVSQNEALKNTLEGLNDILKRIDWKGAGDAFAQFVSDTLKGTALIVRSGNDLLNWARDVEGYFQNLNIGIFGEDLAAMLGGYSGALQKAREQQEANAASMNALGGAGIGAALGIQTASRAAEELSKKLEQDAAKAKADALAKALEEEAAAAERAAAAAKKAAGEFAKFQEEISGISNTKAGGAFEDVSKDAEAFGVALATSAISVQDFNEQLSLLGKKTGKEGFKVIIDGAKAGDKAVQEVNDEVKKLLGQVGDFNDFDKPVEDVFSAFRKGEIDVQAVEEQIQLLVLSTGGSIEKIEELRQALAKLKEKPIEANSEGLFGSGLFAQPSKDELKGFTEELEAQMAQGISNAVTVALEGGDVRGALADFGQSIGGVIGNAVGGPEGAIVGSLLGKVVTKELSEFGKTTKDSAEVLGANLGLAVAGPFGAALGFALGGMFGGMSKDEKLRRQFGAGFNELIKSADIDILEYLDTDDVQAKFENLNLDGVLQPQFDGIAASLATTFGLLEEGGDSMLNQFSQILAVNFQNVEGLNDLQIILQQAGMDAETLQANLEAAYLQGDLGAGEFLNANAQIENLFQQGIPGAIGATDTAFMNFVTNGLNSGAEAKDALGDLGAEMTEALNGGVSSLAELQEKLIAQGADAGKVAKLFEALGSAGISTIEQLTNISTIQSATITNQLQQVQGFFAETTNQVAELENQINALDNKEINIKVKYSSEYDSQTTKEAVEGGTGSTGLGAG
jgi:hypothetical protein